MKINKFLLVSIFLLVIISLGAVNAADNATADSILEENVDEGVGEVTEVSVDSAPDELGVISEDAYDPELSVDEPTGEAYVINSENYGDYFNQSNSGKLVDSISEGATLDFQGSIINPDQSANIWFDVNKPVNIISSTNNAYIDLNTTAGSLMGDNPGNRFTISYDGSGTNMTGIRFHNTQLWLTNTHHVILDNVSNVIEDQRVGSGVGATSIRDNSTYVTVKNSYFYTRNNGGSSSLVLAWADYCTFDNNTVVVEGTVGNMIYLNTFNVDIPSGVVANQYNRIINNRIYGPDTAAAICWGIVINGQNNLVENNTIYYKGVGIASASGGTVYNVTYRGNKLYNGSSIAGMGTYKNCTFEDNYVSGAATITADCNLHNNTINGKLTVSGANVQISDNTLNGDVSIAKAATNTTLEDNIIKGTVTVQSGSSNIVGNAINSTGNYAVDLKKTSDNVVADNVLISKAKVGNDAVNIGSGSNNVVENNSENKAIITLIAPEVVPAGKLFDINVTLFDSFKNPLSGVVSVIDNNDNVNESNVSEGFGILKWNAGEPGTTIQFANFEQNTNISNFNIIEFISTPVTADLYDTNVYVNGTTITDGDNATISVLLTKEDGSIFEAPVVVNVNGVNVTTITTSDDWLDVIITSDLALGINNVTVYFDGNSTHKASNATATIEVEKNKKVTADVVVEDAVYGNPAVLKITNLQDYYGKKLSVYGGYQLVGPAHPYGSIFVSKGKCTANFNDLPAGNYSAYIVFGNNAGGDYQFENYIVNFTVFKAPVNLTASAEEYSYGKTGILNVKVTDAKNKAASGKINVTIDGNSYASDVDINGEANIALENLLPKEYVAEITFDSDNYIKATANVTFAVMLPTADLAVSKIVSNDSAHYGDVVEWTIVVVNNGPDDATNVTVEEILPEDLSFIRAVTSQGIYDHETGIWFIGSIANGEVASFTIETRIDNTNVTVVNNVHVTSDAYDPNETNDYAANNTVIPPEADLSINKTASNDIIQKGDLVQWNIVVTNNGPDDAVNVVVVDVLPAGLIFVDAIASRGTFADNVWCIGDMSNGLIASLHIITRVNASNMNITNMAYVTADTYDSNVTNNVSEKSIIVIPAINNIHIIVEDVTLPADVNVKVVADVDDIYTVIIGDKTVDVVVDGGEGTSAISLPAGENYTATTEWFNDDYIANVTDARFNVFKLATSLSSSNLVMDYNDGSDLEFTLTDDNGNAICDAIVKIAFNGTINETGTDENGVAKFPINMAPGVYDINATFEGTEIYGGSFVNATVTVNKASVTLSADGLIMDYKDGSTLLVTVIDSNNNPVADGLIRVNNTVTNYRYRTNAEGIANVPVTLKPGEYEYTITFDGEDCYQSLNVTKTVVVNKIKTILTVGDVTATYKEDANCAITLADSKGNPISGVTVNVDNGAKTLKYRTDSDGMAYAPVTLKPGEYTFDVQFAGNSIYEASNGTGTVIVNRATVNIEANDSIVNYKDGSNFTAALTDIEGNVISGVTVKFDNGVNAYRYHTDSNGVASAPIKLKPGTYTYTISFAGNSIYAAANITKTLTVEKGVPNLEASNVTVDYKNGNLTARLTDADGNAIVGATVKFTNGASTYRYHTDSNGVATAPINVKPGEYNYTVSFDGNSLYGAINTTANVVVNKLDAVLTAGDVNMTFKDGTNFTAKLTDINGKAIAGVVVKVNNTVGVYKYKTNDEGIINVPIKLKPGEYSFTAFIEDNAIYNPTNVTSTVIITK